VGIVVVLGSLSPNKIVLVLLASAVGILCLFAALLITLHTVEEGSELNQAFAIPLRWFEQISQSEACIPGQETSDCIVVQPETSSGRTP
jgi:hypothetical protein